jgi:protein TonB
MSAETQIAPLWSPESARDRLSSTLFIAALFHGVVIMGVTFTGEFGEPDRAPPNSLEVVMLTRDYERTSPPDEARLLAQQNLIGEGNVSDPRRASVSVGQASPKALPGDGLDVWPKQQDRSSATSTPVLTSLSDGSQVSDELPPEELEAHSAPALLPGESNSRDILADPEDVTRLPGRNSRELIVSANTRESRIAAYLAAWKKKVERVGTMNFPREAVRTDLAGAPTLEVAVDSQGRLLSAAVTVSSGDSALDEAAVSIVRAAAPFDVFPDFLRTDYDRLRFAYEWQFTDGQLRGAVTPR